MPLSNQKQLIAGLDRLAGRALRRVLKRYRRDTIGPLVAAIKKAKSHQGTLKQLSGALLRKMDSEAVQDAVTEVQVQSGLIGRVTAERKVEGRKIKNQDLRP